MSRLNEHTSIIKRGDSDESIQEDKKMAKLTLTITLSPAAKERFYDIKKQNGGVPNAEIEEALTDLFDGKVTLEKWALTYSSAEEE